MLSVVQKGYKNTYLKEVNADKKYYTPNNLTQLVNPKAVVKKQNPSIENVIRDNVLEGNPHHEKRYFGMRRNTTLSPS